MPVVQKDSENTFFLFHDRTPFCLHFFPYILSEKSRGLHQKDDDQHAENDDIRQLCGNIGLGEYFNHSQKEPAQQSAGDGTDSAENRGREGLDAGHGTQGGRDGRIVGAQEHRGDSRQTGADRERERDDLVDIDAHEPCRVLILRAGAHGATGLGPVDEQGQTDHDDQAGGNCDQSDKADGQLAELESAAGHDRGKHLGRRGPEQLCPVLQKITDTDRCDQHRQGRRAPQRFVGNSLYCDTKQHTRAHCDQYRDPRVETILAESKEHDIAADHNDVAMREVQHLGYTIDHRISKSDQCVHTAKRYTSYQIRQKLHTLSLYPEKDQNPSRTN